jgi:hypothetical protein
LFITTKLWNKRQDKMKKQDNQQPASDKHI